MTRLEGLVEQALERIGALAADLSQPHVGIQLLGAVERARVTLDAISDNRRKALSEAAGRLGALATAEKVVADARVFAAYLDGGEA